MCASVVAGCDAAPVLDPVEDVLDLVALAVEVLVIVDPDLAVGAWRDARGDAAFGQSSPEPVAVVALVAQQFLGVGQHRKQQESALVIAHLAFGEEQDDRASLAIADGVQLGVQPALGPPDTSGKSPPFNRLAAVQWALR